MICFVSKQPVSHCVAFLVASIADQHPSWWPNIVIWALVGPQWHAAASCHEVPIPAAPTEGARPDDQASRIHRKILLVFPPYLIDSGSSLFVYIGGGAEFMYHRFYWLFREIMNNDSNPFPCQCACCIVVLHCVHFTVSFYVLSIMSFCSEKLSLSPLYSEWGNYAVRIFCIFPQNRIFRIFSAISFRLRRRHDHPPALLCFSPLPVHLCRALSSAFCPRSNIFFWEKAFVFMFCRQSAANVSFDTFYSN